MAVMAATTTVVTNNRSNFVKVFTTFSVPDFAQSSTDPSLPATEEDCVTKEHVTF